MPRLSPLPPGKLSSGPCRQKRGGSKPTVRKYRPGAVGFLLPQGHKEAALKPIAGLGWGRHIFLVPQASLWGLHPLGWVQVQPLPCSPEWPKFSCLCSVLSPPPQSPPLAVSQSSGIIWDPKEPSHFLQNFPSNSQALFGQNKPTKRPVADFLPPLF